MTPRGPQRRHGSRRKARGPAVQTPPTEKSVLVAETQGLNMTHERRKLNMLVFRVSECTPDGTRVDGEYLS